MSRAWPARPSGVEAFARSSGSIGALRPLPDASVGIFPQIGVLLEVLCFTAGLGYKSHISEKEKIHSQENLIEQLKNGVQAMRNPLDNLHSNWAYMVMCSLAWTLKAWMGLCLPANPGPQAA